MGKEVSCYLSVRIKNSSVAFGLQNELEDMGIAVRNPCLITPRVEPEQLPEYIARECYRMIDTSPFVVLVVRGGDDFGNDCAAEVGYAFHARKRVLVFAGEANSVEEAGKSLFGHDDTRRLRGVIGQGDIFVDSKSLARAMLLSD